MSEICATCGLPKELCVCETIAKESQQIYIKEEKKRFGKISTVIEGIDGKEINIKDLAKKLKSKFACGGTVKGGKIELQGRHSAKIKGELIKMGFFTWVNKSHDNLDNANKRHSKYESNR